MISVQNHQQQLNGSKSLLVIFCCIFLFSSCGLFTGQKGPSDSTDNLEETDSSTSKVDTVKWTKLPEDKNPPIVTTKEEGESTSKTQKGKKDAYRIACFLPMSTHKMDLTIENPKELRSEKYIHYYAGMQFAMEELEAQGLRLTFDVFDSKESGQTSKSILENQLSSDTDVIIGSLRKDALIEQAKFGKENDIPVISPWYSSKSITKENPNYIQLTPYLTEHYRAITEHALANFAPSQIYLLGRENSKDINRFKIFQKYAKEITEGEELKTFAFYMDSLTQEYEIFKDIINRDTATVFVLPNFGSSDAQYIYDVLRRINVEKMDNEVYVYGMPILYSMDKMNYDYYTNMNMRIVMSRFTDENTPEAKSFEGKFFSEYNDFPRVEAYEGYDNVMFIANMLNEYGLDFVDHLDEDENEYFSTRFDIQAITKGDPEDPTLNYYENRNLRIIQFVENQFRTQK